MNAKEQKLWRRTLKLPRLRNGSELHGLIELLPEKSVVAELGSFSGESAIQFLGSQKISVLVCVDLWAGGYDPGDLASGADMEAAEASFHVLVNDDPRVRVLRKDTQAAAQDIEDGMLDLVYLDANHKYEAVVTDLWAWIPKIKAGGLIAGHDYREESHPGVQQAVDEVLAGVDWQWPDHSWAVRL